MHSCSPEVFYLVRTEYIFNNTLCNTLLFFSLKTAIYLACKLLQIRGHRFDSGTRQSIFMKGPVVILSFN